MFFSEADATRFRGMRLDDLDEQYVNVNLDDDDFSRAEHPHQADASPWLIILSLGLKKLMCSIIWRVQNAPGCSDILLGKVTLRIILS